MRPSLTLNITPGDPDDSLTSSLQAALEATAHGQRTGVIRTLAREAAPEALVGHLADRSRLGLRTAAMDALTESGSRGVPALRGALHHADPSVAMCAVVMLGRSRDRSSIGELVLLLASDDANVVQAAAQSLAQLKAEEATEPLMGLLNRDAWVRFAGAHALAEIGSPRATSTMAALTQDEDLAEIAYAGLARIGTLDALEALARALRATVESGRFAPCAAAVAEILHRFPDERVLLTVPAWAELATPAAAAFHEKLIDVLMTSEGDVNTQRSAISVVRALRLKSAYPALLMAAHRAELRGLVRFSVCGLGSEVLPALRVALQCDDDGVGELACECAEAMGLRAATPGIVMALRRPSPRVQAAAWRALGSFRHTDSAPAMAKALESSDDGTREAARAALTAVVSGWNALETPAAAALCAPLLTGPSAEVHRLLVSALGCTGMARVAEALSGDAATAAQDAILSAIDGPLDAACEPIVVRMLASSDAQRRCHAVKVLAHFGSIEVAEHVRAAARDDDWRVRAEVARAHGSAATLAQRECLERLGVDLHPEVAREAQLRLRAIDDSVL